MQLNKLMTYNDHNQTIAYNAFHRRHNVCSLHVAYNQVGNSTIRFATWMLNIWHVHL